MWPKSVQLETILNALQESYSTWAEYEGLKSLGAPKENIPEKGSKTDEDGAQKCNKWDSLVTLASGSSRTWRHSNSPILLHEPKNSFLFPLIHF